MKLKDFIKLFDTDKPNWTNLPKGFPDCDLETLNSSDIGKFNAIKSLWELSRQEKPTSRSRIWKSPNAYIYLVSWSNASLLRVLGVKWFDWLKSSKLLQYPSSSSKYGYKYIDRLEGQFLDELRSTVANIEEGFARPNTSSYLDFLGYSQGSLKEAKGDVHRFKQDGLIKSTPVSSLADLEINLKDWHEALKKSVISKPFDKGSYRKLKEIRGKKYKSSKLLQDPLESYKFDYKAVGNLDPANLTYEQFIELINKTDWHLRKLVESLEKKLNSDRQGYQVEKARIKGKARGN